MEPAPPGTWGWEWTQVPGMTELEMYGAKPPNQLSWVAVYRSPHTGILYVKVVRHALVESLTAIHQTGPVDLLLGRAVSQEDARRVIARHEIANQAGEKVHLWLVEDLTEPACRPKPLAVVMPDRTIVWARGEPRQRESLFLNEIVEALPEVVRALSDEEFEGAFGPHSSIQRGNPWR